MSSWKAQIAVIDIGGGKPLLSFPRLPALRRRGWSSEPVFARLAER
jgi:hypothetical protein